MNKQVEMNCLLKKYGKNYGRWIKLCKISVNKRKRHNGCIKKKRYAELCNNDQIYILAYFNGINRNWLSKQSIGFDDTFWEKIQFLRENKVKLFAHQNIPKLSNDELGNEAKRFFLRLYIQYVKHNGSAPSSFIFDILEIKNYNNRQFNQKESLYVQDEIKVFRFHSDGSPLTQEEFEREQAQIERERMEQNLKEMLADKVYLNTVTEQKGVPINNLILIEKILQINDRVIKYCALYDWLRLLCKNQSQTSKFIKESFTFSELKQTSGPMPPLEKERFNELKGKNMPEDIFTFCRNSIGHSAVDILAFTEKEVCGYIDCLIWPLFRILLEKIDK